MRLFTILKLRLRTLLKSRRLDRELEEELRYHIDLEVERNVKPVCVRARPGGPPCGRSAAPLRLRRSAATSGAPCGSQGSGAICNTLCVICGACPDSQLPWW